LREFFFIKVELDHNHNVIYSTLTVNSTFISFTKLIIGISMSMTMSKNMYSNVIGSYTNFYNINLLYF